MNKRMLIIPGAFVPANDTVTLLTYRRLKHLDIEKDVLALKQVKDPYIEQQLNKDKYYKSFNIEYCMDYENTICIKHPIRLPIGLINMQRYISKAYKKSKQKHYDYLYTSSIPGISHICGYKIKKHNPNIIWYASFSDPIKNAPYKKDPFLKKRGLLYRLMFKVGSYVYMNNKYEEVAIKHADKLIFICEEQRDFTANQYPEYKQSIIDRSIILGLHYDDDWDSIKADNAKPNTSLKAIHVGRIYGLRKIDKFLEVLKEIKEEDNNISNKIVFHQYGEIQPEYIDFIKNNYLEGIFIIHNSIPYGEVLKEMQQSDILVIFDTILEEGTQPYLPSKISEYIAIGKPIFSICNDNSPIYRILKGTSHIVSKYQKEEIKKSILKALSCGHPVSSTQDINYELQILIY